MGLTIVFHPVDYLSDAFNVSLPVLVACDFLGADISNTYETVLSP